MTGSLRSKQYGSFPELRYFLGGTYHKDGSIWGSILGPAIHENYHIALVLEGL